MGTLILIYSILRTEEKEIVKLSLQRGIQVICLNADEVLLSSDLSGQYPKDSIVWVRTPSYEKACMISNYFERNGFQVVNSYEHLHLFGQKILTDLWLKENGIKVIPSLVSYSSTGLEKSLESLGEFPLIIKPNIGGFGNLVHLVENKNEIKQIASYLSLYAPVNQQVLYVQKKLDIQHDLRVILLNGQAICYMERLNEGSHVKNIDKGGNGKVFVPDHAIENCISRLGSLLKQGVFGVDLIVDKEQEIYVCEINAVCRFQEAVKFSNVNMYEIIVEELFVKNLDGIYHEI